MAKLKEEVRKTPQNFNMSHRGHVGQPMSVIRLHFRLPEAPQELNYEFTFTDTLCRSWVQPSLLEIRNADQTRESSGNKAYQVSNVPPINVIKI